MAVALLVASGGVVACKEQGSSKVAANAPADCAKVGEILATFELGAGAQPDARATSVAKYRDACKTHNMNAAEATCVAKATSTWQAIDCAPRMFPDRAATTDCRAVAARTREAILGDMPKEVGSAGLAMVDKMVPIIEASCRDDNWPAAYRTCVVGAKPGDMGAFKACDEKLPQELQLKMGERLKPIVQATLDKPADAPTGSAGSAGSATKPSP
jgi:hypothetical protein